MFFNDFASNPEHVDRPEFDNSDLEKLIETFISFWSQKGIERADIIDALLSTEPFALSKDYCKNILQRKGYLP
jgi:hypothetical protein